MSSLAINNAGREVPVRPVALINVGSTRLGFVMHAYYTVQLCWMSATGEICRYGLPCYSGVDWAKARDEQSRLVNDYSAEAMQS